MLLSALSTQQAVSGNALAQRLGVTRAAVWKQIEALRALGAPIEAAPGSGYRLAWPLQLLDAASIRAKMDPALRRRFGAIDVHWQLDSTSSALLRAASAGAADLSVCIAETQTAGRGRRGRAWLSPLGGNVYISVLKRFAAGMGALSGLSLVAGVALMQALGDLGISGVGLKWPNDVLAGGGKLAGTLVELGGEFLGPCYAVIGIGVNVRLPRDVDVGQPSADLADLCGASLPSRNTLIARLLDRLAVDLDGFAREGFAPFRPQFANYDLLAGRMIQVHTTAGMREGHAEGVDDRGALRVRHDRAVVAYDSAEVSVRA